MKKPKIIIIGAGIAGLAAANELQKNGIEVTIIEARNHIGGRTYTDYSLGFPFDLGGSLIHGLTNNPLADLANRYGAHYLEADINNIFIQNADKNLMSKHDLILSDNEFSSLLANTQQQALQAPRDMTLQQAFNAVISQNKSTLKFTHTYPWQLAFLSAYAGKEAKYLSARHWDESLEFDATIYLMTTGYVPIVNGLAKDTTINLNTEVTAINYDHQGVSLETTQGLLQADAAIITVPLGVLKNNGIRFYPALPPNKQKAITRLQMGLVNKIALRFPNIFWPQEYANFSYLAAQYHNITFFVNFAYYFQQPVLVGFIAGDLALQFEHYDDQTIINNAMEILRDLFGENIPNPVANTITRWQADPYSGGAYSCVTLGATGEDYAILAEPIGQQIYFAGEATNRTHPATVHGAYLSGIREAKRILSDLHSL